MECDCRTSVLEKVKLLPVGPPCTLRDCPVGTFATTAGRPSTLGVKVIVRKEEHQAFWLQNGRRVHEREDNTVVQPVVLSGLGGNVDYVITVVDEKCSESERCLEGRTCKLHTPFEGAEQKVYDRRDCSRFEPKDVIFKAATTHEDDTYPFQDVDFSQIPPDAYQPGSGPESMQEAVERGKQEAEAEAEG